MSTVRVQPVNGPHGRGDEKTLRRRAQPPLGVRRMHAKVRSREENRLSGMGQGMPIEGIERQVDPENLR